MPSETLDRARDQSARRPRDDAGGAAPASERPERPAPEHRPESPPEAPARKSPAEDEAKGETKPTLWDRVRKHPFATAALLLVLVVAAVGTLVWWLNARHYESTDDAFIDARSVSIASEVKGSVVALPVTDNQPVEAGAVLVQIDKSDYQAALDQAQAQVDQAEANIANIDAQIDAQAARIEQARKDVIQAQAALTFSRAEEARTRDLRQKGTDTEQQEQQAASDLRQKQAAYEGAEANAVVADKQTAVLKTQRAVAVGQLGQARAALEQAKTNLRRTTVTAAVAGRVTKIGIAKGSIADVGQSLMMLVPRDVWVTANFKETQVYDLRPGQPVEIRVDAYPGRIFAGHVDSVQAGSGAAFSLLPPENATGNYVKVLQRVPVKIVFDRPPDVLLGPGMSVVPDVKVQ